MGVACGAYCWTHPYQPQPQSLVPAAKSHTTSSFIIISTVEWMSRRRPSVFQHTLGSRSAFGRRAAQPSVKKPLMLNLQTRELKILCWNAVFKGRGHGLLGDVGKRALCFRIKPCWRSRSLAAGERCFVKKPTWKGMGARALRTYYLKQVRRWRFMNGAAREGISKFRHPTSCWVQEFAVPKGKTLSTPSYHHKNSNTLHVNYIQLIIIQ